MSSSLDALVIDLLEWLGPSPRPYGEVLDVWRTSCSRLPVCEEANDRGLIERLSLPGGEQFVTTTALGKRQLSRRRPLTNVVATDSSSGRNDVAAIRPDEDVQ